MIYFLVVLMMVIEAPLPLHLLWKVGEANPSLEALKHKVAFLFPSFF